MFQAVREWWSGGRGKITARLFLFELFVVVVGVLIAQAVANTAQGWAAAARMEQARAKAREHLAGGAFVASGWQRSAICLDRRMEEILRLAAREDPIPAGMLQRPSMMTASLVLPDEDSMLLLARRHGDSEAIQLRRAHRNLERLSDNIGDLTLAWEGLVLVNPAFGPTLQADREAARLAAARIKSRLAGVRINAGNVVDSARRMGIAANASDARLIRNCRDMWTTGETVPEAER